MSPLGRHYFIAQDASPGLIVSTHFLSPNGATLPNERNDPNSNDTKQMLALLVPLLKELILLLSVCTQSFISGFALISPWTLQEYRAYGTHNNEESNPLF